MNTTGPTAPTAPCPVCSGERLYGLVYRHENGCSLWTQLDSTQARDQWSTRSRPATPAELTLCAALGAELTGGVLARIVSRPPIWLRVFTDGKITFDPDAINEVTP